jgi:hypothetical protein
MTHKANGMPCRFDLYWRTVFPKSRFCRMLDEGHFGRKFTNGSFGPLGTAAKVTALLAITLIFLAHTRQRNHVRLRARTLDSDDGVQFVRCRICGDRYRVISGRHLSKHDTDRETYMEEYGLSPDELSAKDFRMIMSSRKGYHPYGKGDWVNAIRKLYKQNKRVFASNLQVKYPHLYDQGIWIFGDWDKALRAAGFDPERMRIRRFWDKEKLIGEIRRMRNEELPLYAKCVMRTHGNVFYEALRQYGSWSKALLAAGITKKEFPRKLYKNRLGLLRALRDTLEGCSASEISQALRLQAEHYFGSVRNAIAALKKDRRLSRGWSKLKILTTLSRMHRAKVGLAYAKVRREFPALVSAAEAYFGSWGKALNAAGIDPNLYFVHHKWRKGA